MRAAPMVSVARPESAHPFRILGTFIYGFVRRDDENSRVGWVSLIDSPISFAVHRFNVAEIRCTPTAANNTMRRLTISRIPAAQSLAAASVQWIRVIIVCSIRGGSIRPTHPTELS